jgi:hypothetical protein
MKPNINSVKVLPQLSNNRHTVDGEVVFTVAPGGYIYTSSTFEVLSW